MMTLILILHTHIHIYVCVRLGIFIMFMHIQYIHISIYLNYDAVATKYLVYYKQLIQMFTKQFFRPNNPSTILVYWIFSLRTLQPAFNYVFNSV